MLYYIYILYMQVWWLQGNHGWHSPFETKRKHITFEVWRIKHKKWCMYLKELLLQHQVFQYIKPILNWRMQEIQYIVLRLIPSPSRLKNKRQGKYLILKNKIGGWRVSKYAYITLPNELYQVVENQITKASCS